MPRHRERHVVGRVGWLRAAVLGANDGLLSTASLLIGMAAAATVTHAAILVAGVAALIAGAMSMAAGEYVSVSSQRDAEQADLTREADELASDPAHEERELAGIYEARGLDPVLARQVAVQLTAHDALGAHARDELGMTEALSARPLQAALSSALAFAAGALAPLSVAIAVGPSMLVTSLGISTLVALAVLGALGARAGGAPVGVAVGRVVFWGAVAMAVTAGLGRAIGTAM